MNVLVIVLVNLRIDETKKKNQRKEGTKKKKKR